jgi:Flp pilus assembly protein, protease CpaA
MGVLMLLLVFAAISDIKTGRIPNWLVFGGALYGIVYNTLFPLYRHDIGILFALGGLALGLAALLPVYLFRALGPGDVKLMAMVGAFIGAKATFGAVLSTFLVGGLLAVAIALWSRRLSRMVGNVTMMFRGTMLTFATGMGGLTGHDGPSAGRMPYGVAIALGTIAYLTLTHLGLIGGIWS